MSLTSVYGTILNVDNTPIPGVTVSVSLNAVEPIVTTGGMILSEVNTSVTNASGYWALSVIPNDQITEPRNTSYTFTFAAPAAAPTIQPFYAYASTVKAHGATFSKTVTVPSASGLDFDTLV